TNEDVVSENSKPKRTVSYIAAQGNTKILELENRCTGNRTIASNPPLRQQSLIRKGLLGITDFALPFALPLRSRSAPAPRRGHIVSPVPDPCRMASGRPGRDVGVVPAIAHAQTKSDAQLGGGSGVRLSLSIAFSPGREIPAQ
ncbi:MAG TPA: hypothetical protein VNS88_11660, partial [Nitrospiraceae bacterium]|nr:hypothetical protein [Nitrospiraceae bacterium]